MPRMTETNPLIDPFPARVVRWRIFVFLALAAARGLLRLQRAGSGQVWARADQLELITRAGFATLNDEIAEITAAGEPETPEAAHALDHLRLLAICLLALALFLQSLKDRLPRKGAGRFAGRAAPVVLAAICFPPLPAGGTGYLDSS